MSCTAEADGEIRDSSCTAASGCFTLRSQPLGDIALTAAIIVGAVILFVWNRLPVVMVAMGLRWPSTPPACLSLDEALGGLGDPAVIFIATLFVVSAGLEATGVTAWAGQLLIARAGKDSRTRLLVLTMLLVSLLTALISVNGAVAALLPVVVVMAVRLKRMPSQLLMPLVFSAHAGSMLALTGTPVNVLVSNAASDAGVGRFGFFEFTLVGVPLLLGAMAIIILFGERLLPHRSGPSIPSDFSKHAQTLVEQYGLSDGMFQMRVRASSPFVGALTGHRRPCRLSPACSWSRSRAGDGGGPLRRADHRARATMLILRGEAVTAAAFAAEKHCLRQEGAGNRPAETLFNRESGLAEVIIPPRSGMIGTAVFPGMVTESGDLVIMAVQRRGSDLGPDKDRARGR